MYQAKSQSGYTLIELILYVGIIGGLLFVISLFFVTSLEARIKNQSIAEVNQQGYLAMDYMTQTLRNATSISSPAAAASATSLTLVMPTPALSPTIFSVSGGVLYVKEGTANPIALTGNKVQVSSLNFTNLSRAGTPGAVRIDISINRVNLGSRNEFDYAKSFQTTAALRWP